MPVNVCGRNLRNRLQVAPKRSIGLMAVLWRSLRLEPDGNPSNRETLNCRSNSK